MLLRVRNLWHLVLPQCRWLISRSPIGQLRAASGHARMTSAAETSPMAIVRLSAARASRISLARPSARKRCGSEVFRAVSVMYLISLPLLLGPRTRTLTMDRRRHAARRDDAAGPAWLIWKGTAALVWSRTSGAGIPAPSGLGCRPVDHNLATRENLEQRPGHSNVTSR